MRKPGNLRYEKRRPHRDAFLFIIVCEGANRETEYFQFFDGMSSRLKIVPIANPEGSAPKLMADFAAAKMKALGADGAGDAVWFVVDTDRWRTQLRELREECNKRNNWKVVQSNPCFEVWLYFHVKAQLPQEEELTSCRNWKPLLPRTIQGGFNSNHHPALIEVATENSKSFYTAEGHAPHVGCTQLWQLGEALLPLIKRDLELVRTGFHVPVILS